MFLKNLIRESIHGLGYELTKIQEKAPDNSWFSFDESCQIPFLSSIYESIFGTERPGFLVEIGAYDAVSYSNSSGLLDRGWGGLLVEPVPIFADLCRERHKSNPNVQVVQKAISNKNEIQKLEVAGPLSTLSSSLFEEYEALEWSRPSLTKSSLEVETISLNWLLESMSVKPNFELLIVDVEGFEFEVFDGFDLNFWSPQMIIVELSDFHPNLKSHKQSHFVLGQALLTQDYSIIYKDAINTIFLKSEIMKSLF